jgi:purine-nucleoside phosphorylase
MDELIKLLNEAADEIWHKYHNSDSFYEREKLSELACKLREKAVEVEDKVIYEP